MSFLHYLTKTNSFFYELMKDGHNLWFSNGLQLKFYFIFFFMNFILLIKSYINLKIKPNFNLKLNTKFVVLNNGIITLFIILSIIGIYLYYLEPISNIYFNLTIITDNFTNTNNIILMFTIFMIISFLYQYTTNNNKIILEHTVLILLTAFFLMLLIFSYNFFLLFMCIIGFSLNIYVLLLNNTFNHISRESAIKYFYLSIFSSGLLISGVFLCYILSHTLIYNDLTWLINMWTINKTYVYNELQIIIIVYMLYFISFGLLFKLSAFPCHLWTPDVYEGSPNPITTIFILPIKIGTFVIFLRIYSYIFSDILFIWTNIICFSAILSLLWGAICSVYERKIKRFVGYSSINQIGILLIGVAIGSFVGAQSSIIYFGLYIIMNILFFILFMNTYDNIYKTSMIYLTDLNKFAKYNQIYIGSLVILLFSLAGIPPLAGFLGKYYLFLSGFEQNYYLLVITGLVTSLVSGYYYLNIIKIMLFDSTYTQTNLYLYQKNFKFNTKYKMYNNVFTNAIFFFCEIILIIFIITHNSYFNVIINTTLSCLYPLSITANTLIIDSL